MLLIASKIVMWTIVIAQEVNGGFADVLLTVTSNQLTPGSDDVSVVMMASVALLM